MPGAQARMTVRRRPADGRDGQDAVVYSWLPSAGCVVRRADGTLRPSAVSARLLRHEGGAVADMAAQSFDGHVSTVTLTKADGSEVTKGYVPGSSLTFAGVEDTVAGLCFKLSRGGAAVAQAFVTVVEDGQDGADGQDVYLLDLDNEVQAVACTPDGTPTATGTLASCNATVYKGGSADSGWTFGGVPKGCEATVSADGRVAVTAMEADTASVKVVAAKGAAQLTAYMSLYKARPGVGGQQGEPGADAVVYAIQTSASVIRRAKDGTLVPSSLEAHKTRTVGGTLSRTTEGRLAYQWQGGLLTLGAQELAGEGGAVGAPPQGATSLVLRYTAADGGTTLDQERVPVISDGQDGEKGDPGEPGEDGKPGKDGERGLQGCIYRRSEWAAGKEYRNDIALTTGDERYIDLVCVKAPDSSLASKAKWFRCRRTHSPSSADNAPHLSGAENAAWRAWWEELNETKPLATPLLLADNAVIDLLQSSQVVVMKEDGVTVNAALGGGAYPLWVGASSPAAAPFAVDDRGRAYMTGAEISGSVTAGDKGGQRVELLPSAKAMKVYDSTGAEVASFEGNAYGGKAELFGGTGGMFSVSKKSGTMTLSGVDGSTRADTSQANVTAAVQSDAPVEVVVSGHLSSWNTESDLTGGTSSGGLQTGMTPDRIKSAYAVAALYVDTYSDAGLTQLLGSVEVARVQGRDGDKALSSVRVKTVSAGHHVLRVWWSLTTTGSGMSAWVRWGSACGSGKADLSASYAGEFYVSRYFANGFCLGQSASDYVMVSRQEGGMRLVAETSGYGLDVSRDGLRCRHHSGNWAAAPMLVFHGHATYTGSGDSLRYGWFMSRSHDGSVPAPQRAGVGLVRVEFPATWLAQGINPRNCIIHVTGVGNAVSGDVPVTAQILSLDDGTGVTVRLTGGTACRDGQFALTIHSL